MAPAQAGMFPGPSPCPHPDIDPAALRVVYQDKYQAQSFKTIASLSKRYSNKSYGKIKQRIGRLQEHYSSTAQRNGPRLIFSSQYWLTICLILSAFNYAMINTQTTAKMIGKASSKNTVSVSSASTRSSNSSPKPVISTKIPNISAAKLIKGSSSSPSIPKPRAAMSSPIPMALSAAAARMTSRKPSLSALQTPKTNTTISKEFQNEE